MRPINPITLPAVGGGWRLSPDSLFLFQSTGREGLAQLLTPAGEVPLAVRPACSLLLMADQGEVRPQTGQLLCWSIPLRLPCRLLAFLEHWQLTVPAGEGVSPIVLQPYPYPVQAFEAWFVQHWLFAQGPSFRALLSRLRRSEAYWLIRHLLLERDAPLTLAQLARSYGVSVAHFRRLAQEALGQSAKSAMMSWRLRRTVLDAICRGGALTALALRHGYASSSHFSNDARQQLGLSPQMLIGMTAPVFCR